MGIRAVIKRIHGGVKESLEQPEGGAPSSEETTTFSKMPPAPEPEPEAGLGGQKEDETGIENEFEDNFDEDKTKEDKTEEDEAEEDKSLDNDFEEKEEKEEKSDLEAEPSEAPDVKPPAPSSVSGNDTQKILSAIEGLKVKIDTLTTRFDTLESKVSYQKSETERYMQYLSYLNEKLDHIQEEQMELERLLKK